MGWHHIKQTFSVLSIVLVAGISAVAVYSLAHGTKFLSVQSGSMVPTFRKGDLVIDTRVPARQIAVGDVVTYTNPVFMDGQPITHRVVQIPSEKNGYRFTTKGDANKLADPSFGSRGIIGKVSHSVPYLGYAFDFVRKPLGLILLIYLPALAVIIVEIRRLMKYYKDMEPYVAAVGSHLTALAATVPPTKPTSKARFIPVTVAVATITTIAIAVPTVQAALMTTATLNSTTLSTRQIISSTPLIYKVVFNDGTGSNNGNNTTNNNSNNVSVNVNNPQTATSGNATSSGGNATSGNASTSSNTNVNINVSNNGSGNSNTNPPLPSQSVTIYNPTNQAIDLAGWKLSDNNGTQTISSGNVAAKGYFTFTWPVNGGLDRSGDHLSLQNAASAGVDSLSWGSDTSQLNPAITTTASTATITRKTPGLDTNTATDWLAAQ